MCLLPGARVAPEVEPRLGRGAWSRGWHVLSRDSCGPRLPVPCRSRGGAVALLQTPQRPHEGSERTGGCISAPRPSRRLEQPFWKVAWQALQSVRLSNHCLCP